MSCTRQHIVVTGASSGIGRATALRLASAGYHVFAGVRTDAAGHALVATAGKWITPLRMDVTDADQIAEAAAAVAVAAHTERLDGLVNNAGVGLAAPVELLPPDTLRGHFETNVIGQLAVTQAFLPRLRPARGRIVFVSTIGVRFRPPFAGALDAAKAAVATLADALRQELAPWGDSRCACGACEHQQRCRRQGRPRCGGDSRGRARGVAGAVRGHVHQDAGSDDAS